ncbi:TPA: hypothetical protein GXZ54_02895 [bacterium]|nr:hypothetical protein [bacterium]
MVYEIKTIISEKVLKALSKYQLFEMKKKSFIFITIMLLVGMGSSIYALITYEEKSAYIVILILLPLLYGFLFFISPLLSAKAALKRLQTEKDDVLSYLYHFDENQFDVDLLFNGESRATNNFTYDSIDRVVEYKDYLYLVMKENFIFVINKLDNDESKITELKDFLEVKIKEANAIISE